MKRSDERRHQQDSDANYIPHQLRVFASHSKKKERARRNDGWRVLHWTGCERRMERGTEITEDEEEACLQTIWIQSQIRNPSARTTSLSLFPLCSPLPHVYIYLPSIYKCSWLWLGACAVQAKVNNSILKRLEQLDNQHSIYKKKYMFNWTFDDEDSPLIIQSINN